MRVMRLNCASGPYLEWFYRRHPALGDAPYAVQEAALAADFGFQVGDAWRASLETEGVEASEVCVTAAVAQRRWADEQGLAYRPADWLHDIVERQVQDFQPTIVFVGHFGVLDPAWLTALRRSVPSIEMIVGWCGVPGATVRELSAYDAVLSCVPELVDDLRTKGLRAAHLHHGFDERVLAVLPPAARDDAPSAMFAGQIVRKGVHETRERLLEAIVASCPLVVHTDSAIGSPRARAGQVRRRLEWHRAAGSGRVATADRPPWRAPSRALQAALRPAVYGTQMFTALRDATLAINVHLDVATDHISNRRMWEATGAGGCLLTDWKPDLHRYFEPDVEVLTYRSVGEAVATVRELLGSPALRDSVARAGQQRTLRDHTQHARALSFLDIITELPRNGRRT